MSIPDSIMMDYFELVTDVPDEELKQFRQELYNNTVNPMELKKRLAREIIGQLYDKKAATEAEEHFTKVIQQKETPEEIKLGTKSDVNLREYLVKNQLAKSGMEAKRLIEQGAVYVNGKRITNPNWKVTRGSIIRVGKRGQYIKST
jgi:tyrosyl-tRNA synthetase